jgi:hypothetical protein
LVEGEFLGFAIERGGENFQCRMEFRHDLTARATGADWNIGGRYHGDAAKRPLARRHSGSNRDTLGAHGQTEAEIFDIAASENRAVLALERRADGEVRVWRVGIRAGERGGLNESGVFHVE